MTLLKANSEIPLLIFYAEVELHLEGTIFYSFPFTY